MPNNQNNTTPDFQHCENADTATQNKYYTNISNSEKNLNTPEDTLNDNEIKTAIRIKSFVKYIPLFLLIVLLLAISMFFIANNSNENNTNSDNEFFYSDYPEISSMVVSSNIDDDDNTINKQYKYYDDFNFTYISQSNDTVANGSLAIINHSNVDDINIDYAKMVLIYEEMTNNIYGISSIGMEMYKAPFDYIDRFIVDFYKETPKNGLIINRCYTSAEKLTLFDPKIDLATGYSVQFSIYASSFQFSDPEFAYLKRNAYQYGIIQRFPNGKKAYTGMDEDHTIYRYVGLAHSQYMNYYRYSLEEYLEVIRDKKVIEFNSMLDDNTAYVVYYVPIDKDKEYTDIQVPQNDMLTYEVSGDGSNGFIVTVEIDI